MLDEFQTTNHSIQQQRGTLQDFWILPPAHSYKVNVDGQPFLKISKLVLVWLTRNMKIG